MATEIPSDLVPFVQRMVSEKRFLNESDVLAEGLRLLQSRKTLRAEVRKGFDQFWTRGKASPPKTFTDGLSNEFNRLKMAMPNGKSHLRTRGRR